MTKENETGITGLVVYKDYRALLNGFKNTNSTLVFDYESKKGNKEARSHIAKMKRVKTAVEKTRTGEAKIYREALNDQADFIKNEIDSMILVHQKPLDEFEQREQIRIDAIKNRIDDIFSRDHGTDSESIQGEIDLVNLIDLDKGWDEFIGEAIAAVGERLKFLNEKLAVAIQYEADQAELARLRKAEADRLAKEKANEEALEKIDRENSGEGFQSQCDIEEDSKTLGVGEAEFMDDNGVMHDQDQMKTEIGEPVTENNAPAFSHSQRTPASALRNTVKTNIEPPSQQAGKSAKEKRLEAEEDFENLGFTKLQSVMLVRKISLGSVRNIKFEL